jgi:hypothetical protein
MEEPGASIEPDYRQPRVVAELVVLPPPSAAPQASGAPEATRPRPGRQRAELLTAQPREIPVQSPSSGLRPGRRRTSQPVRRILFAAAFRSPVAVIHLGVPLPTCSCGLPADSGEQPSNACAGPHLAVVALLGLAPGGVYRATPVTRGAGGLLPHRFTLTGTRPAVSSLWHFPAGRPGLPLATTLLCGVRTFLGGVRENTDATARSTRPSRFHPTGGGPDGRGAP